MSDLQINTNTESLAQRRAARRHRKTTQYIIMGTAAAFVIFAGLMMATAMRSSKPLPAENTDVAFPTHDQPGPIVASRPEPHPALGQPPIVADDGETMWNSPTAGGPIDLAGLPSGCEMFVSLRPTEILGGNEGEKVLAALGPRGAAGVAFVERAAGLRMVDIEHLLIGLRPANNFSIQTIMVVTPRMSAQSTVQNQYRLNEGEPTFVVATPQLLDEVREQSGLAPPLRREVESILEQTDAERHITIVVTPTFLFDDGRQMWQGAMAGIRKPLFDILPDSTRCAALSLHFSGNFFAELRLVATIDQRPLLFAKRFADKVSIWPGTTERLIASLQASTYSATVVARLPAMLRALSRYQRVGVDHDHALLRVYLPSPAGHNLLMAGELLLAELMVGGGSSVASTDPVKSNSMSIEDRLEKAVSLSFARDTLETAVGLLGEEIGVEIVLMGGDLQLDGITKNQSFGLDEQDKPAGEVLVSILRLANPDKTAEGPADPKQKLVYVLGVPPGGTEPAILVTTRSQAEKRGDELPTVFVP